MKFYLVMIGLLFSFEKTQAQNIDSSGYENFYGYIGRTFRPPEVIRKNCEWQYAVVKVLTDKNNQIVSYSFLNKTPEDLKKSFNFLIGYKFSKKLIINKHPVVFCISMENQKDSCALAKRQYTPSEVLGIVLSNLTQLFESDAKAIFLPRVLEFQYSFDPIY